jgi:hypothetical protein
MLSPAPRLHNASELHNSYALASQQSVAQGPKATI